MHRPPIRALVTAALGMLTVASAGAISSPSLAQDRNLVASTVHAGTGIMVGEVSPRSALVQVRLSRADTLVDRDLPGLAGMVEFSLATVSGQKVATRTAKAEPDHDFIARVLFDGLTPGEAYRCTTKIGANPQRLSSGPRAEFRTLGGSGSTEAARFVVVTGMNYGKFHGDDRIDQAKHLLENNTKLPQPYSGPDKHLGYPALAAILAKQPNFFVGTGDNVYYDTPKEPRAKTTAELRRKWHEQFVQPRYRDLFAKVSTYWMIDDHDYRVDDCDNTGDYRPTPAEGRRMMLEQLPVAPRDQPDAKTYRTHRVNRDLQIWFPENRMYRSPNAMPDGPGKSIWGETQKEWLKQTLAESDAAFKLLISPTPMVGPDDRRKKDNHTNIGGFRHERDAFFAWLDEQGLLQQNFYVVCGDRHWQYHAEHPSGVEEFSCGALVDANSRLGRAPGDPQSTDPDATIKQPYSQDPRSGGFLMIEIQPSDRPQLTFTWFDERGIELHRHTKTAG